jgi:hypothetical protein
MQIRKFLPLLLLMLPIVLFGQEEEKKEKKLEWQAVEGASFYLVEIENGGVILYSLKTEEPFLPLFLTPGEYNVRISVFNKFEKLSSRSDWNPLTVFPSPQPLIEEYYPSFFFDDETELILTIKGKDFDEACLFNLINGSDTIKGRELSRSHNGEIISCEVSFSDALLPEIGIWDLAVGNPSGRSFSLESVIRSIPRARPEIDSIKPDTIYKGENPGKILLKGKNFSSRAALSFNGPSKAVFRYPEIYYGADISFYLDPETMDEGTYTVSVVNEGGLSSEPISFTLTKRTESLEETIRKNRERTPLFLGIEYHASFPISREAEIFEDSPLGFSLRFRKKFQNSGIYRLPVLRQCGLASGLHYTWYKDAIADYLTLSRLQLDGGIYYLSDWNYPVNLYVSFGFGASYSLYFFIDDRFEHSLDFSDRIETGLQYRRKNLVYELGYAILINHYQVKSSRVINPYIMIGWQG